jgi:prephenate dehydrogenase
MSLTDSNRRSFTRRQSSVATEERLKEIWERLRAQLTWPTPKRHRKRTSILSIIKHTAMHHARFLKAKRRIQSRKINKEEYPTMNGRKTSKRPIRN